MDQKLTKEQFIILRLKSELADAREMIAALQFALAVKDQEIEALKGEKGCDDVGENTGNGKDNGLRRAGNRFGIPAGKNE